MAGCTASLNCFISKSAEKSLPFFTMLRNNNLAWGPSPHEAFEGLKQYLENIGIFTSPTSKADILLYIATSESVVSTVLVEERNIEGTVRKLPIYFVVEALSGSKILYSEMEKLAYALSWQNANYASTSKLIGYSFPPRTPLKTWSETGSPHRG